MPREDEGRDRGEASISQGLSRITGKLPKLRQGWGRDSPSQFSGGTSPASALISDFQPLELEEMRFCC